jgi:precorrin-6B methylase 2
VTRRIAALLLALLLEPLIASDETLTVPFITTPEDVVHRMLELAETRPGDLVVDLGSGDGRIVIEAAKRGASFSLKLGSR